jgi:hypothetical protein
VSAETPSAFCSYSREDAAFALKLAEDLKAAGANVWMDQIDIEPGTPWDRAVEEALAASSRVLVILSPASVSSDNVSDELSFALSKHKRLIPVLYRECDVPFRLARLQHIDFTHDYERGLKALIKALSAPQTAVLNDTASEATRPKSDAQALPEEWRPDVAYENVRPRRGNYSTWTSIAVSSCLIILVAVALVIHWSAARPTEQAAKADKTNESVTKQNSQSGTTDTQSSNRKPSGGPPFAESANAPAEPTPRHTAANPVADQLQLAATSTLITKDQENKRYRFSLSIQSPAALKENIARINYDLEYATNPLAMTSDDPTKNFEVVYEGWGCYQKVVVTVIFKSGGLPEKRHFNMCTTLGW